MSDETREAFKNALWPPDLATLRKLLEAEPELANSRPWAPAWTGSAIEGIAGGCVWHRPDHMKAAALLLEFGARCSIQTAARAGLLEEVVRQLMADPSLLDSTDAQGRSALYRATCVYGAYPEGEAIATCLRDRGATVDICSASTLGLVDRVRQILAADRAASTRPDPDGMTALHWAVRPRKRNDATAIPIMTLLLDAGADIHACNQQEDGMMPIHHVGEWCGTAAQLDLLLARGADLNARAQKSGWTPLDYAIDRDRRDMVALMRAKGGVESGRRGQGRAT